MILFIVLIAYLVAVHIVWLKWYIPQQAQEDFYKIKADGSRDTLKTKWHIKNWARRATMGLLFTLPLLFFSVYIFAAMLFILGALFWARFDVLLNRLRGLPENYIGKNAFLDKVFGKYPDAQKNVKGFLLILGYCFLAVSILEYLDSTGILVIFG